MLNILGVLAENGTVVLAFFGLIGYFIKRIFDLKSKKIEIKYNLYHQAKLKYMIEFQASYFAFEKELSNYTKAFIKNKTVLISEVEERLSSKLEQFNASHENIRFFIKDLDKPAFDRISKNLWHFHNKLVQFFRNKDQMSESDISKSINELEIYNNLALKQGSSKFYEYINANYRMEFESDNSASFFKK